MDKGKSAVYVSVHFPEAPKASHHKTRPVKKSKVRITDLNQIRHAFWILFSDHVLFLGSRVEPKFRVVCANNMITHLVLIILIFVDNIIRARINRLLSLMFGITIQSAKMTFVSKNTALNYYYYYYSVQNYLNIVFFAN